MTITISTIKRNVIENLLGEYTAIVEIYFSGDMYVVTTDCWFVSDSGNYDVQDAVKRIVSDQYPEWHGKIAWETDTSALMIGCTDAGIATYLAGVVRGYLEEMYQEDEY